MDLCAGKQKLNGFDFEYSRKISVPFSSSNRMNHTEESIRGPQDKRPSRPSSGAREFMGRSEVGCVRLAVSG